MKANLFKRILNYLNSFFNDKENNLEEIEKNFNRNYSNIISNNDLIKEYFEKILDVYNNKFNQNEKLFDKVYDFEYRMVEYTIKNNLTVSFIRKIIFIKILIDFNNNYKKDFIKFGENNDLDVTDIMFISSFTSEEGWSSVDNKLGNMQVKNDFDYLEYYKLVLNVEKKIIEISERDSIEKWNEIIIKIV